ncbi:hypothetical protein B0J17DRAFT_665118 [Rhizoctonia solani]|nr:hypothetical protein B0J17DRAFT_665118 [Rhizoctonia solani]
MASPNISRGVFQTPWKGDNKIIIGIDIGTHNSGAAFVYLSKGAQPLVHRVASWPGQAAIDWQSKIPTIVLYDTNMRPLSIGAEALLPGVQEEAGGRRWSRAMNFRLQPPPESLKFQQSLWLDAGTNPSPSPQTGASLKQVYSDYLKYLLLHTETAFRERVLDGSHIWTSLAPTMKLIVTHPSGWEAGYTDADQATANINFLTEAEAAIYFYMHHTGSSLKCNAQVGTSFLVCDIGVSTTVINVCTVESTRPALKTKQHCSSACIQTGSKAVDRELEQYLRRAFMDAGVPNDSAEEYTKNAVQDFEKTIKYRFGGANVDYRINLGNARHLTDSTLRVRRGTMTLPGPYLRQEFNKRYAPQGSSLPLAGDSTSKAYALGALLWNTITASPNLNTLNNQSQQTGNATQFYDPCLSRSYGFETSVPYDRTSHEGCYVTTNPSGIKVVQGKWLEFIHRDKPLDQNTTIKKPVALAFPAPRFEPSVFELTLYSYCGNEEPSWMRDEQGDLLEGFRESCHISVDLTQLAGALEPRIGLHGVINWHIEFNICLHYRADGFQAEVQWQEKREIQTTSITTRQHDI